MPPPQTDDAIIFVPGIMGSRLKVGDHRIWGYRALRANLTPDEHAFEELLFTEQDRNYAQDPLNQTPRVEADDLFASIGIFHGFGKVAGYSGLLRFLNCNYPAGQVLTFPYDWRLDVHCNGKLLKRAAEKHLHQWRGNGRTTAQLVLIGHSMGGLVIHRAIAEGLSEIRQTITLGTPYGGSIKALSAMIKGTGIPTVPNARVARTLTRSLPGCYDLLPSFPCVAITTPSREATEHLSAELLEPLGVDRELFKEATERRHQHMSHPMPNHRLIIGNKHRTMTSVRFSAGNAQFDSTPNAGDDTVTIASATVPSATRTEFSAQGHFNLAIHGNLTTALGYWIAGHDAPGPLANDDEVSIDAPDVARAGDEVIVEVQGVPWPAVRSTNLTDPTRSGAHWAPAGYADLGTLRYRCIGLPPGLHEVEASGGGGAPSTALIVVAEKIEGD